MSRRTSGTVMLALAALLYAARYLAAAIYGSSMMGWSSELFASLLQYVGQDLVTWSTVALVAGLAYLAWAEITAWRSGGEERPEGWLK